MIAYVAGRIAEITENTCVVVTAAGVGYELFLSSPSLSRLSGRGEEVRFFTCTVVREDALELFGFDTWDERDAFLVLISISRVGARTAMAILSVFRPDDLRRMVADNDALSLTRVSGIGKKTGQQIFLELGYKLKGKAASPANAFGTPHSEGTLADAVAGLVNLGYAEADALAAAKKALTEEPERDVGETLRAALKTLARRRS
ncbi:MAG: Holliday junction branch migration protein RuvA [Desulfovibrio sp.]|jgi:Holliday junction DNA helicase RuvA|nr:Holliday junction branch migration protein RuvA [Desulfovibrio sp.]